LCEKIKGLQITVQKLTGAYYGTKLTVRKLTGNYYGAEIERFCSRLFVTLCLRPARVVGCIAVSRWAPRSPVDNNNSSSRRGARRELGKIPPR